MYSSFSSKSVSENIVLLLLLLLGMEWKAVFSLEDALLIFYECMNNYTNQRTCCSQAAFRNPCFLKQL